MKFLVTATLCLATSSTSFAAAAGVKKIVTGSNHSCALLDNGKIKCWGRNDEGRLGTGDNLEYGRFDESMGSVLPFVQLGETAQAIDICAGTIHSCAALATGKVKCWGGNDMGQLGLGIDSAGSTPDSMGAALPEIPLGESIQITAISCGNKFTCATTSQGRAKCWGDNQYGQLGVGSTKLSIGKNTEDMGKALPYVMLGNGAKIKSLKAGSGHACALLENGRIKCWGANAFGQLGYGDTAIRGRESQQMGDKLAYVDLGDPIFAKQISTGLWHTCAVSTSGSVKCWGNNATGSLGIGDIRNHGQTPGSMGSALPPVLLGAFTAEDVYANAEHTCAKASNNNIKCWGQNEYGQLGIGDSTMRGRSMGDMGDHLPYVKLSLPVKAVTEGKGYHTCALTINSLVKCWGKNNSGQLGYSDEKGRGTRVEDMGDFLPFVELQ